MIVFRRLSWRRPEVQVQPQVALFHKWAQNAFVHITWICKKQGAVSHWTAKAEVIALNAGIHARVRPLCVLGHCDPVVWSYESLKIPQLVGHRSHKHRQRHDAWMTDSIDYVAPSLPIKSGFAMLLILSDDDVVIRITVKQHLPTMWHVKLVVLTRIGYLKRIVREAQVSSDRPTVDIL